MHKAPVTAALLTHNEAEMVESCLATLSWCERIIVLDQGSTDDTVALAKKAGAQVLSSSKESFARRREQLLTACSTDWILYIDADERVTPTLAGEIETVISENIVDVACFPRQNIFFGQTFTHGGWQNEIVTRLFRRSSLQGWQGDIHESPVFSGTVRQLSSPLWHFSHRSIADGLIKTAHWTPMEAHALAQSLQSKVTIGTILRKGLGSIWHRGILAGGWKDGQAGRIELLTQAINRMLVYMQVWELQQQPPVSQRYQQLEKEITSLWQQEH